MNFLINFHKKAEIYFSNISLVTVSLYKFYKKNLLSLYDKNGLLLFNYQIS